MKTCLACRARLRLFRDAPARVAEVVPPVALVAADGGGSLRGLFESALGAIQHEAAVFGERAYAAAEVIGAQKAAAVAASASARSSASCGRRTDGSGRVRRSGRGPPMR
jgi:hypothetical protein